jgi:hypothetical protein
VTREGLDVYERGARAVKGGACERCARKSQGHWGAHLGSAAADRLDDWSDIDLALCISAENELVKVIATSTSRMYRDNGAVAHCDVKRGDTLYRVFLLRNSFKWISVSGPCSSFAPSDRSLSSSLVSPTNRPPRLRTAQTN